MLALCSFVWRTFRNSAISASASLPSNRMYSRYSIRTRPLGWPATCSCCALLSPTVPRACPSRHRRQTQREEQFVREAELRFFRALELEYEVKKGLRSFALFDALCLQILLELDYSLLSK